MILTSLIPAVRLALREGVSLQELKQLSEMAYYREAKRRRLRMRETAELMSISMAKVGLLSKQLKAYFAEAERDYELPRRILSLLWAGPMTAVRIARALPDAEVDEVDAAIEVLVASKRIQSGDGRTKQFHLSSARNRLVAAPWMARIDALGHLMRSVGQATEARFIRGDDRAFARTVGFRMTAEDAERLKQAYDEHIFPLVVEIDENSADDDAGVQMNLGFHFAPDIEEPVPIEPETEDA